MAGPALRGGAAAEGTQGAGADVGVVRGELQIAGEHLRRRPALSARRTEMI